MVNDKDVISKIAASIGSVWRRHRRDLSRDIREPFLDLLLALGQHVQPDMQASSVTNIKEHKSLSRI